MIRGSFISRFFESHVWRQLSNEVVNKIVMRGVRFSIKVRNPNFEIRKFKLERIS
jgi:hypothetical protein